MGVAKKNYPTFVVNLPGFKNLAGLVLTFRKLLKPLSD